MKQINKMNATRIFGLILFLIFLSYDANSLSFSQLYHFDENCYDVRCKDIDLLFDKVESKCIYEPIIFEGKETRGNIEDEVMNIDEFLNLKPEQRGKVAEIYKSCVKNRGDEFAERMSQAGTVLKVMIKVIMSYFILLLIQGIILTYLLRRFIKKRRKVVQIFLVGILSLIGLIIILFLFSVIISTDSMVWPKALDKFILGICSRSLLCQTVIKIFPFYLLATITQGIIFISFRRRGK